jgi:hypothetical protein
MANSQHRVDEQGGLSSTHHDPLRAPSGLDPGDAPVAVVGAADSVQGQAKPVFVCAWHEDKAARHAEIEAAGGLASDGICGPCRELHFPRIEASR